MYTFSHLAKSFIPCGQFMLLLGLHKFRYLGWVLLEVVIHKTVSALASCFDCDGNIKMWNFDNYPKETLRL